MVFFRLIKLMFELPKIPFVTGRIGWVPYLVFLMKLDEVEGLAACIVAIVEARFFCPRRTSRLAPYCLMQVCSRSALIMLGVG